MKRYCTAVSYCAVLGVFGQSWSHELSSTGRTFATGLQDNGVLVCGFNGNSCTVSRLDPFGSPIWSYGYYPELTAVWDPQEEENGDLLCCVHLPDPENPSVQVNGVMRLTSSGAIIRVSVLRSAPRDPSNPYGSYLVLHAPDDGYHFVYVPGSGNAAKVYWMSADDNVLADIGITSNYLPVTSMTELNGSIYGVGVSRMGKMAYDGTFQWMRAVTVGFPAHHLYEVVALGDELLVRYQFDVGDERRPALARFDTTGALLGDLVLDLPGTGIPDECFTVLQGPDIIIGAYRYDTYETMLVRVDTALTTWAAWTDDRLFSILDGCRPAGNGIILTGMDNQNGHRFVSRSGPAGGFAACWTELPLDTLSWPWPSVSLITQATMGFDPLLVQVVVTPAADIYTVSPECISLGGLASPAQEAPQLVSIEGGTISILPVEGTCVRSAVLLDPAGRTVAYKSGSCAPGAPLSLHSPGAGCYMLRLVLGDGGERLLRVVVAN